MSHRRHAGFTLVELLVVITVIAMLMALLIPTAKAIMERANQVKCLSNMNEIGTAILLYESNKNGFPPECSNNHSMKQVYTTVAQTVPWPALLVAELGRGDWNGLRDQAGGSPWYGYMGVLTCPSNPVTQIGNTSAPLHYAANVGRLNGVADKAKGIPTDWKENGVFMDRIVGQPQQRVTKDWVASNDGVKFTLMVMESLCTQDWSLYPWAENNYGVYWTGNNQATDPKAINDPAVLKTPRPATNSRCYISSRHPGGVNVLFCAGNARWLNETVGADVIDLMMTPNGKACKEAGSLTLSKAQLNTFVETMIDN